MELDRPDLDFVLQRLKGLRGSYENNQQFFRGLRRMLSSREERGDGLNELLAWMLGKSLELALVGARGSAKGIALRLLQSDYWASASLNDVEHLGALAPLALVRATRGQYVQMLVANLLEVRKRHPALALGAPIPLDTLEGETRLTVAQSWAILLNTGHLFGTFATERALAMALSRDQALMRELLVQVDPSVREPAEKIIRSNALHRFHYALAAWRVSQHARGQVKRCSLELLGSYFAAIDGDTADQALWAFRRARQVTFNQLHAFMQIGSLFAPNAEMLDGRGPNAVDHIYPDGRFTFHTEASERNTFLEALTAFDRHHHQAFFSSPAAAAHVLDHVQSFERWWESPTTRAQPLGERLSALFLGRVPWSLRQPPEPRLHFERLVLPARRDEWLELQRDWDGHDREGIWCGWSVLQTPEPGNVGIITDIYWTGELDPRPLRRIAERLARRRVPQPIDDASKLQRGLWRSYARFGGRVLEACLREEFGVLLEPLRGGNDAVGYAVLAMDSGDGCRRVRQFANQCTDAERAKELRCMSEVAANVDEAPGCPWLAFLARVHVLNARGDVFGEIDGVWMEFCDSRVVLHFAEVKTGARGGGTKQLRKLERCFNGSLNIGDVPIQVGESRGRHASLSIGIPLTVHAEL